MSYNIIDKTTGIIDSSYDQFDAANLILRNLNKKYHNKYEMKSTYSKKFVYNGNRPSEAQLWRINEIEKAYIGVSFQHTSKEAATKFLERYIHGGYKEERLIEPPTDEERYIMSMPL